MASHSSIVKKSSVVLILILLFSIPNAQAKSSAPAEISNSDNDIRVDNELQKETIELKPSFLSEDQRKEIWSATQRSVNYLNQSGMLTPAQLSGNEQLDFRSTLESLGYDAAKAAQINEVIKLLIRKDQGKFSNWEDPALRDQMLVEAGIAQPPSVSAAADEAQEASVEAAHAGQNADLGHTDEAIKEKKIQTHQRTSAVIAQTEQT